MNLEKTLDAIYVLGFVSIKRSNNIHNFFLTSTEHFLSQPDVTSVVLQRRIVLYISHHSLVYQPAQLAFGTVSKRLLQPPI